VTDPATSQRGAPDPGGEEPRPAPGAPREAPPRTGRFAPAAPAVPPRELARLLDQVPIGIVSLDAERRVRLLNQHAKAALGVRARDVAGRPVGRAFPGAEEEVAALLDEEGPSATDARQVRCDGPDGDRWLELLVTGFNAPGGDHITVLLLQDVTARVGAELAVRESYALLSAVAESTNDILFVTDRAGRYLLVNRAGAALFGRAPEDCIGRAMHELFEPESAERIRADDLAVMAAGEPRELEETLTPRRGEPRVYLANRAPYRDPDGHVVGVVGVLRDITDRKRNEERLQVLATAGELLGGSLDHTAALEAVARAAVPTIADGCIVDVVREGDRHERVAIVHTDPAWEEEAREVERRWGPRAADAAGSRFLPDVDPAEFAAGAVDDEHRAALERLSPRSLITVPLGAGGARLGALTFVTGPSGRRLDGADLRLAEDLARRAASAVAQAQLHAERAHIARTLQESLLPPRLPDLPGATVACRLHAAGAAHDVGGDFYDLFPLRDGGFLLVIGDVGGRGAEAAAVTALARYTIRGSALRERNPARVLALLSEALLRQDVGGPCSVLCARLEPRDGGLAMVVASGGHPLPLLLSRDGTSAELGAAGALLGGVEDPELPESAHVISPGETAVFYTDGVTAAGTPSELAAPALPWTAWGAEAVASRIEAAALAAGDGEPRDDLALVVLELAQPGPDDRIRAALPTGPKLAAAVRATMEPLRERLGRTTFATVRLLVDELVANAERHGTPHPGAPVGLEVAWTDELVRVAVSDSGPGFAKPRRRAEPGGAGGWGLLAVDRLGRRWGVEGGPLATVWVEVAR
jgi:PAS domain S-box-containing protein